MLTHDIKREEGLDPKGMVSGDTNKLLPEFIRLPKQGCPCPWTGMSRAKLAQLLLPNEGNGFSPPVKSISLGPKAGGKGTRLVHFSSLMTYLNSRLEEGAQA